MTVEVRNEHFRDVVGDDLAVERLGTGFLFTEGPVWHPRDRHLTFSDMPGDHMRRWFPDGRIETFRRPSNMANGNTYDADGRLLTCEHATSRVTRTEPDGSITVLATHYGGKELNSPNDIVVRTDGTVFFTDPAFGRREFYGVPREQELDFQGVYAVDPDGSNLRLLADDFDQPNGLCLSLDETMLFVNDTPREHIRRFDLTAAGMVSGGEAWADVTGEGDGAPDGMKLDADGNLYTTGPGGIHVFAPDATCLGVVEVPERVANFTWGADDLKSLFITASTSLYRTRTRTAGRPLF